MTRIEKEKKTVSRMIHLYCRKKEGNRELCRQCRDLQSYALSRLDSCPFGENKTSCKHCCIHCYRPEMREKMRQVMQFSGPRMLWYDPLAAFEHLLRR